MDNEEEVQSSGAEESTTGEPAETGSAPLPEWPRLDEPSHWYPGHENFGDDVPLEVCEGFVKRHAPGEIIDGGTVAAVKQDLQNAAARQMFVMSADIRRSTTLMKEAIRPERFAKHLTTFIEQAEINVRNGGGWFDKFLGDGFLAYWPLSTATGSIGRVIDELIASAIDIMGMFRHIALPLIRETSQNFPVDTGLSIGLDLGPASFVTVARDLTIVGSPVVGAVRMASAARPWETLANVVAGVGLEAGRGDLLQYDITIKRTKRKTKEFPLGQDVYKLGLPDRTPSQEAGRRLGLWP